MCSRHSETAWICVQEKGGEMAEKGTEGGENGARRVNNGQRSDEGTVGCAQDRTQSMMHERGVEPQTKETEDNKKADARIKQK